MGGAELLTPKEWGRDSLAGQLRARQMWMGMMVPGWSMQREAKLGGFYQEGQGPSQAPRGVLLMLLAPPLRMPPTPSHDCACGFCMSYV